MELVQSRVWSSVASLFDAGEMRPRRNASDGADGWRKFQQHTTERSESTMVRRLDFMKIARRLNVTSEELRSAIFESMDVVAVGDRSYMVEGAAETTPLLSSVLSPRWSSRAASLAEEPQASIMLRSTPRQLTAQDNGNRDYIVLLENLGDGHRTGSHILVGQSPDVISDMRPGSAFPPETFNWRASRVQLLPSPSFGAMSPHGEGRPFTPFAHLSENQRSQLLGVQEDGLLFGRASTDNLSASNIPMDAARYGMQTGMAGYLVGTHEDQNLLHLPAAVNPSPRWATWLMPSRIKSIQLVSCNADVTTEPTVFYSRIEYARPFIGWIILFVTLTCFALMAPVSKLVAIPEANKLVAPVLVTGWRTGLASLTMAPFCLLLLARYGLSPDERLFLQERTSWLAFLRCGIYQCFCSCGYNLALAFTTIPQAVLFCNLHPMLIIMSRLFQAESVSAGELGGVLVGMLGMALVIGGEASPSQNPSGPPEVSTGSMIRGDAAGLMCSVSMCLFLTSTKSIRSQLPLSIFLAVQLGIGSVVSLAFATVALGATITTDTWSGLLGFIHSEWTASVVLGGLLMLIGWLGTSAVTKYLNPVVISTCLTLEPAAAIVCGVLLGAESFPTWITILGCVVMLAATIMVGGSSHDEDDGRLVPLVLDDGHGLPEGAQEVLYSLSHAKQA